MVAVSPFTLWVHNIFRNTSGRESIFYFTGALHSTDDIDTRKADCHMCLIMTKSIAYILASVCQTIQKCTHLLALCC